MNMHNIFIHLVLSGSTTGHCNQVNQHKVNDHFWWAVAAIIRVIWRGGGGAGGAVGGDKWNYRMLLLFPPPLCCHQLVLLYGDRHPVQRCISGVWHADASRPAPNGASPSHVLFEIKLHSNAMFNLKDRIEEEEEKFKLLSNKQSDKKRFVYIYTYILYIYIYTASETNRNVQTRVTETWSR